MLTEQTCMGYDKPERTSVRKLDKVNSFLLKLDYRFEIDELNVLREHKEHFFTGCLV